MNARARNVQGREAELVKRVCAGEKQAFYQLVEPCERAVFTTAMSVLRNEADAEEVSQEAVLKALCALPRFRRECKFSTWLIQITINEARVRLRKDRRALYESIDEVRIDEFGDRATRDFADVRENPFEEFQRNELGEALTRALETLAPRYREVLVLRDLHYLSTQETAQVLGVTKACVKIRLLRARLQMRDALRPVVGRWRKFGKVRGLWKGRERK
jgi:RNA polymerase sigma-70 factor, ECF subfamily